MIWWNEPPLEHSTRVFLYVMIGTTNKSDGNFRSDFISPTKLESSGVFPDNDQSKVCHVYRRT